MIGKVTFAEGRTAILHEDMRWETPGDPGLSDVLATLYLDWSTGPAEGEPGHLMLHDAADFLRGTVTIEPRDDGPDPPGLLY